MTTQPSALAHQHSTADWAQLALLVLLWGTTFAFIKVALHDLPPLSVAAARTALAAAVLTLLGRWQRAPHEHSARHWQYAVWIAITGNALPFFLVGWGQQRVDSALAGLLMALMPLATLVLAHFFVAGDRMTPSKAMGFGLGLCGLVVLVGPASLTDLGQRDELGRQAAILVAALSYAVATVLARRMPKQSLVISAARVTLLAAVLMLPLALAVDRPWEHPVGLASLAAVVWLGLMSTALATLLYFRVVQSAGPTFLSQTNFLIPVVALGTGVVVMGEPAHGRMVSALILILTGLAIAQWRRRRPTASMQDVDDQASG